MRSFFIRGLFLAFLLVIPALGQGTLTRSLLLVWDTRDDSQSVSYLQLVQALKTRRAAGHFDSLANFDHAIKVYDLNEKSHAQSLALLDFKRREDAPYVAIISLGSDGLPQKILWGVHVDNPDTALAEVDRYLGLKPPAVSSVHWTQEGERWVHDSGLSLAIPSTYAVRPENGGLKLQNGPAGAALLFYPAADHEHRSEALALFRQNLISRQPGLQFSAPRHRKFQGLNLISYPSRDGVAVLGTVGNGRKCFVYSGQLGRDGAQGLARILESVQIR